MRPIVLSLLLLALAPACVAAGPTTDPGERGAEARLEVPGLPPADPTPASAEPRHSESPDPAPPASETPTIGLTDRPNWRFELTTEGLVVMNDDGTGRTLLMPYEPMTGRSGAWDPWFDFSVAPSGWTAVRVGMVRDGRADPRLFIFHLPDPNPVAELPMLAESLRPLWSDGRIDHAGPEWTEDWSMAIHLDGWASSMA